MLSRERVRAAIDFAPVDVPPVWMHPSPAGLYEHGEKLLELMRACGHDFGDAGAFALPEAPAPEDFDGEGRYHAFRVDEWGTRWEYRIFGVWGHPVSRPLDHAEDIHAYRPPTPPGCAGAEFDAALADASAHLRRFYRLGDGGSIFEKMHSLRRFEDVLMDVALDTPEINVLADTIADNVKAHLDRSLALGCDGVGFGDDFGTENSLILSRKRWREFFKPRYERLFEPVRDGGRDVFYHSCGLITDLLGDLKDLGVDVLWPQLAVFDMGELAARLRDLHMAVALHPDRGELMQRGAPEDVRRYLHEMVDAFDTLSGGSIIYIEIDPGFRWENIRVLFETVIEMRGG